MTKVVTIFGNVTDKCNIGQPNLPPLPVPRGLPIQSATFATRQWQITKVLPTTLGTRARMESASSKPHHQLSHQLHTISISGPSFRFVNGSTQSQRRL